MEEEGREVALVYCQPDGRWGLTIEPYSWDETWGNEMDAMGDAELALRFGPTSSHWQLCYELGVWGPASTNSALRAMWRISNNRALLFVREQPDSLWLAFWNERTLMKGRQPTRYRDATEAMNAVDMFDDKKARAQK